MSGKRKYNLKNQRLIHGQDNVAKMGCCIFLVLLVISGLIGLTVYIVKNTQSISETNRDQVNYHDVGNNKMSGTNKQLKQQLNIRNDYSLSTVEGTSKVIATSTISEFTATSIESPLSTSTMSPRDVPPRFLFVSTNDHASTDYSSAGSTNDYVQLTTKREFDESSVIKRSTPSDLFNDAPTSPDVELLEWDMFNEELILTTPELGYDSHSKFLLQSADDHTCSTNLCKQSTSRMLALINHTADPCDDFYSYACGGFDINHFQQFTVNDKVLESIPDITTLDRTIPYEEFYHDFIISCNNYKNGEGLKELSKLLYDLCRNNNDLTDLVADILMIHPKKTLSRILPLFDIIMEVGPKKTLIPTLSLPKQNSPLAENNERDLYEQLCRRSVKLHASNETFSNCIRSFITKFSQRTSCYTDSDLVCHLFEHEINNTKSLIQQSYKECLANRTAYFKNLQKSILLLQIFEHLPEIKKWQKIKETLEFIGVNILDEFGFISEEEFYKDKYDTVSLNWLTITYPEIEWKKLFEKLFGDDIAKAISEVRLTHTRYLVKIFEFFKFHKFEDIKNSLLSMMAHDMYIDFIEPQSTSDRYKYCLNLGTKLMPDVASKLYLEKLNPTEFLLTENKLKLIFEQLIVTFNTSVNANSLINDKEQNDVSDKISKLNIICNPYIVFFNFEKNFHQLYGGVQMSTNDYISNVYALKKVLRRRMYDTHGHSAESADVIWNYLVWPTSDTTIRITETYSLVLPMSIIEKLYFDSPKIEEFASVGFLMAQEISRFLYTKEIPKHFSNENNHLQDLAYSKKPNIFRIELDKEDLEASKYSRFIDGMALRVTLKAYSQFHSADKSFPWTDGSISKILYLLIGQQFCNAKQSSVDVAINLIRNEEVNYFRVNSMMENSEDFLNTFECRYGS